MNSFNPMHYADFAMVLGVSMFALGFILLGLVAVFGHGHNTKGDCD